jgi:protein SCO1/2
MLNFMFAGCGDICPGMAANLVRVQKLLGERMGRDIFMYSITLAPEHDTSLVLKTYAEGYRVKAGWSFLTGAPGDIEQLRRALGFTDSDPVADADKTQHLGLVAMGNDTLDRWIKCPAMLRPERIVKTLAYLDPVPTEKGA